jgi:sec-independent protein translocase protein TatC
MPRSHDYPDDIFDQTRMSFGDHIEELRSRLLKAIYGLLFFLIIGFILDSIGEQLDKPWLGIGRPMMRVITEPVESQARAFYARRNELAKKRLPTVTTANVNPDEERLVREKLARYAGDLSQLSSDELAVLRASPREMPVMLPVKDFEETFGIKAKDPEQEFVVFQKARIYPVYFNAFSSEGEALLESRRYLTTLSATEAFMVYFKVSLLCGFVLGSPWIFYQLWAFIAAGLYPHEKKYVHLYLPFSVILFLAGVLLCQFIVLPGAVKALLGFNNYIDLDPDLRLNEWLGFAIMLPLVFGISFQTPLVMFFLNRLGMFSAQDYMKRWRGALFILAIVSAVLTPTPDVVTMLYLFVPMFGLYGLGIAVCHFVPPEWARMEKDDSLDDQVAV